MATGTNGIATLADIKNVWSNIDITSSAKCATLNDLSRDSTTRWGYLDSIRNHNQLLVFEKIGDNDSITTINKSYPNIDGNMSQSVKIGDIVFQNKNTKKIIIGRRNSAFSTSSNECEIDLGEWCAVGQCISTPYYDYMSDYARTVYDTSFYQFAPLYDIENGYYFTYDDFKDAFSEYPITNNSKYVDYLGVTKTLSASDVQRSIFWLLPHIKTNDYQVQDLNDKYGNVYHGSSLGPSTSTYRCIASPRYSRSNSIEDYYGVNDGSAAQTIMSINPLPDINPLDYFSITSDMMIYNDVFNVKPAHLYDFLLMSSREDLLKLSEDDSYVLLGALSVKNLGIFGIGNLAPIDKVMSIRFVYNGLSYPQLNGGSTTGGYSIMPILFATKEQLLNAYDNTL